MAGDEPVVGTDVRLGRDHAHAVVAAGWVDCQNPVHHAHGTARYGQRPGQFEPSECRSEAAGQIPASQAVQLFRVVPFTPHGDQVAPVVRPGSSGWPGVDGRFDDALARLQLLAGEEPGAAVPHGQQRFAPHRGVEAEAEQVGAPLAEKVIDADVVADRFARTGQAPVKGDHRVQQAVHRLPPGDEVDPQVAGEEQVRLARLHRDAGGDPAAVQVPGAGMDVVFGHDPAAGHGPGFPFQDGDPVHQHERFVRQSHPGGEGVHLGKGRTQHAADAAPGKLQAQVAVVDAGNGGNRWHRAFRSSPFKGEVRRGMGVVPGLRRRNWNNLIPTPVLPLKGRVNCGQGRGKG